MSTNMFDVEGFILVGGQSRRMGNDKSRLVFGGQTGTQLIAATLRGLVQNVRLVGARDADHLDGLENLPDTQKEWGALGGIEAALAACGSEWAMIAACDLPLITPELLRRLWRFKDEGSQTATDAIVPVQPDGRPQPLCALYRRESSLRVAQQLISAGEHKPRALLAKIQTRWVKFDELMDLPGAANFFLNVNTPADYERAVLILANPGKARL